MNRLLIALVLLVYLSSALIAQEDTLKIDRPLSISEADFEAIHAIEDTLGVLGYAIITDSLAENRFGSCHQFIPHLVKALKHKNSFDYTFDRLHSVSILYPPDSTFRVFTWQLYVDKDEYHYYGAIQMNSEDLQLFPLVDRSQDIEAVDFDVVDHKNWYGALYYNIRGFDTPKGKKYLVFGFDGHSFFNKRKVIDVLHFEDGKPKFGAPVFHRSEDSVNHPPVKFRVLKEFYAEAKVKLNYDEVHGSIIFDHIVEMGRADNLYNVPDGSYEGYRLELETGKWIHIEKAFDHVYDEAPRPEPVFMDNDNTGKQKGKNVKRKNIFGND